MGAINWDISDSEDDLIHEIVERAFDELPSYRQRSDGRTGAHMDIAATHLNGCRLDLRKLLTSDAATFAHDVLGIHRHLNRQTARLENHFDPRCSLPVTAEAL